MQTNETTISFYGKLLASTKKPCFAHFVPIHKSYVVNPDYIDHISTKHGILAGKGRRTAPISRTYQPLVEKWLMQH
ncbi:MAG: LytTR family transcriptional regulator DNA-binding domain-containing protein [Ruminococcus callidus]